MRCDRRMLAVPVIVFLYLSITSNLCGSDSPLLVYKKKYVMGTVFEVAAYDRDPKHASNAIQKAFQEIVRVDDLLSNYKSDSALSRLNRSAHFHAEQVPAGLYRVVEQAVEFSRLSNGKFDISVAPLVDLWKAALSGSSSPSLEQQEKVSQCVGYQKIELIPPDRIAFQSSCLRLDLGAIGKGFAVDRAGEILRSEGIQNALINAGGSTLLALGSPPGQSGWLVHLRDPSQKIDPQVMLKDESVSTSEQTPPSLLGIDSPGHIIDPDTGRPLQTEFAVSAVAKTGIASDALSTTLLLLGPERGKALVQRIHSEQMREAAAVWISRKAQIQTTTAGPQILFEKRS